MLNNRHTFGTGIGGSGFMHGSFANFNSSKFNNLRQSQHNGVNNPEMKQAPVQPPSTVPEPLTTTTEPQPQQMKQNILNPVS
jgi:hypothetical protein